MQFEWFDRIVETITDELKEECGLIEELEEEGVLEFNVNRMDKHVYFELAFMVDEEYSGESFVRVFFDNHNNEFYARDLTVKGDEVYPIKLILNTSSEIVEYLHTSIHNLYELIYEETEDENFEPLEHHEDEIIEKFVEPINNNTTLAHHIIENHPEKIEWLGNPEQLGITQVEDSLLDQDINLDHALFYRFGVIPELNVGVITQQNQVTLSGIQGGNEEFDFGQHFVFNLKHARFISIHFAKKFMSYMTDDESDNTDELSG